MKYIIYQNEFYNDLMIASRRSKGISAISQIMSLVSQLSLGNHYMEIALVMRDSRLLSKLVYSWESWYHITTSQYCKLEEID